MATVVWSHSSLKNYEGCPRRYYEERVAKNFKFKDTQATLYGTALHKAAEDYIGEDIPLPPEYAFIQGTLDALKTKPGRKLVEHKMALTEQLVPCDWTAPDVWVRGIADLLIVNDDNLTARVVDYKTGNNKYPDREQLKLMSMMVFAHFPHIREVKSALLFVVKNDMVKHSMARDKVDAEWWRYRERTAKVAASMESGVWNPQQSGLCGKYCAVITCEHNGRH